jgi:mono/diheme cytochrome c family protein
MKIFTPILILIVSMTILVGCTQKKPSENPPIHLNPNMDDQPKYEAMEESEFFLDKSTMRMPVEGTVARGELNENSAYYMGKYADGTFVRKMPVKMSLSLLKRGQKRYEIYCTPCHGGTGAGQGIVIKKGFLAPQSYHIDRLRDIEDGYIYDVISNGIRNMPSYGYQIPVADRWAIVAYVRALQRSQNATITDIPEDIKNNLK